MPHTHTQYSALIETLPNGLFPPELWLVSLSLPRFVIALTTIAQAILVLGKLYMGRRLKEVSSAMSYSSCISPTEAVISFS